MCAGPTDSTRVRPRRVSAFEGTWLDIALRDCGITTVAVVGVAALAGAWSAAGHRVVLGARDPDGAGVQELAARLGARVATAPAAATEADVVVLAVPFEALADLVPTLDLAGRVTVGAVAFMAGDSPAAKEVLSDLGADLGFAETVDVGGLDAAPLVEALAATWITLAYRQGRGPDFAFALTTPGR